MKINFLQVLLFYALGLVAARAVEIDDEAQKLIGLETARLVETKLPPQVAAYGTVLAPTPLVELFRQIGMARADVVVSKQSLARVEDLFASRELVARKDVEAARAQVAKDQSVIQGVEDRLMLEWGSGIARLSNEERTKLLDDLLSGKRALVRLSVARDVTMEGGVPVVAHLKALGRELKPLPGASIFPARSVDPAFQTQSFLAIMNSGETPLAVGAMLTGSFDLKGEPREGVLVPASAVVFYMGKAWIYQEEKEEEFERVEIATDTPVDSGWFLEKDALEAHPVVTKGVQSILSKETIATVEED